MNFETKKNITAGSITLLTCLLLLIVFVFVQWVVPVTPPPISEEGIEVNLGNSEAGVGNIPPEVPGNPSEVTDANTTTLPTANTTTTAENIATDENEIEEAVALPKKEVVKPTTKPTIKPITEPAKNKPTSETASTPPTPKPKALMGKYNGEKGTGGNNADSYNGVTNQGIAGGNGDQGKPNGNPNSDSYNGNASSGNSGVSIRNGLNGRRFTKLPSFEDEFNENAKVAVDIEVNAAGNVTNASINPKGTTTTNSNIRNIALKKAKQLKLNTASDDIQTGTIVFNFKLKG